MFSRRYWTVALIVLSLTGGAISWGDPTPMQPHVQRVSKEVNLSFERLIAPDLRLCGGLVWIPCEDPDEFCKFPMGTCDWADHFGECTPIPDGCPDVWDPVCGCDGVTYGNECEADAASMSIDHWGPCSEICGGFMGIPCENSREFCKYPIGTCEWSDYFGECAPIPGDCPEYYDPVCGCDGVTYDNECFAYAASMSLASCGPCRQSHACFTGTPCEDPELFCKYPAGTCDLTNNEGVCTPIQAACPRVWDPVCGCDGVTYSNACEADAGAVSVDYSGMCR